MKKLLVTFIYLISSLFVFAEADYVYHETTTNTIGLTSLRFRDVLTPNRTQTVRIGFKIEFQFFWNQARIYYTTDGSNPSGAFGVGNGTTQVVNAVFDHNFGSPVVDAVFGFIPPQPSGTVVRYIVSAWDSGGGDEIFANGCGNAPRTFCASDNRLSSQATVFQYRVDPLRYYINDGFTTGDIYTTAIGDDTNDGLTPNTPKATVTDLLNDYRLVGTDTIYIDRGNYTESFTIDGINANTSLRDEGNLVSASPFIVNYLVFKGAGRSNTIFTSTASFNVFINRAKYVLIENISFINNISSVATQNILREYGESGVVRRCSLVINNTSINASHNIFFRCNKRSTLDTKRSLISSNIMTNNNNSGTGIYVLGDVDFSRFERNTISMTGTNGKGMVFEYSSGLDESGGTSQYWPISDTIFSNTITSNHNAIELNSSSISNKIHSFLIEGNNITINNTTSPRSGIYLQNCGNTNTEDFEIMKNIIKGGYSGIYILDRGEFLKIYNNYICSIFGLFSQDYIGGGTDRENEFLHNSLYTTGSCLYFNNDSQDDWDVRNNILYTTANSNPPSALPACISVVSWTNSTYNFESLNGNLFYRTGSAYIGRINSTTYSTLSPSTTLGTWQNADISFNSTNDPNSREGIPPYQNVSNCDLDLVPNTTNWPGSCNGYPNFNCLPSFGVNTNSIVNTDIKNIPTRTLITIGAFEVGSVLPINETEPIRVIREERKTNVTLHNGIITTNIKDNLLERQNIIIFDASGKLLFKTSMNIKGTYQLDISKYLSSGVNYIKVLIENKTYDKFIFKTIK